MAKLPKDYDKMTDKEIAEFWNTHSFTHFFHRVKKGYG